MGSLHHRCHPSSSYPSSLSLSLLSLIAVINPAATVAFSVAASAAAATAAAAAIAITVAIAVAAATAIAVTAAVVDCHVFITPPPKNLLQAIGFIAKPNLV